MERTRVFIEVKLDSVYVVKSRTEQEKVPYSDNLKLCKFRKSLIDFQGATGQEISNLPRPVRMMEMVSVLRIP